MTNDKLKMSNDGVAARRYFNKMPKAYLHLTLVIGHLSLCLLSSAWASFISLDTTITAKVAGQKLQVLVAAVNKGDEAAYNVQAEVRAGGQTVFADKTPELAVNGRYAGLAEIPLNMKVPGEYPLVIVLHYADANLYPFSALKVQPFSFKSGAEPGIIFGRLGNDTFWQNGSLRLDYKNLSGQPVKIVVSIVAPQELTVGDQDRQVELPARGNVSRQIDLTNFSALSGSTYQVYAVAEYEQNGRHQVQITPGLARLVQSKTILGLDNQLVSLILVLLVLAFIYFQFGGAIFKKK